MRDLFQPVNLKAAFVAAVATSLACYPRLVLWVGGSGTVWYFELALLWCTLFLWGFVFAWHEKYSRKPIFQSPASPKLWLVATLCAIVAGMLMRLWLDPALRKLTPQDFPQTYSMWIAMTLFTLALDQLFLCFAPFAFLIRLVRRPVYAIWGTVILGLLIMALKLSSAPELPPNGIIAALVVLRIVGTYLTLQFYLRGGALLVWWWVLLMQLRHLLGM